MTRKEAAKKLREASRNFYEASEKADDAYANWRKLKADEEKWQEEFHLVAGQVVDILEKS